MLGSNIGRQDAGFNWFNYDGLEERAVASIDVAGRLLVALRSAVAATPTRQPFVDKARSVFDEVMEQCAQVKAASTKLVGPRRTMVVGVDGYERAEPEAIDWCNAAGLELDVGAAASVVASEVARLPPQYRLAVVHATANEAMARFGDDELMPSGAVLRLVTGDRRKEYAGHFGRQSGRWCATIESPRVCDVVAAKLAVHSTDWTRGARRWVDPMVMDRGRQNGKPLAYNGKTIIEKWALDGWEWVGPFFEPDGKTTLIDYYRLMLFRKVPKPDVDAAIAAVLEGRRRWRVTPRA